MRKSVRDLPIEFTCPNCGGEAVKKFEQYLRAAGDIKCSACLITTSPDIGMLKAAVQASHDATAKLERDIAKLRELGDKG